MKFVLKLLEITVEFAMDRNIQTPEEEVLLEVVV